MRLGLSTVGYREKPSNVGGIRFREVELDIDGIRSYIMRGYTIQCPFGIDGVYGLKGLDKNGLFRGTNVVSVDLDDTPLKWRTVNLALSPVLPSIIYETFSNGLKGYRYRLLYVFSEELDHDMYAKVYGTIVSRIRKCGIVITDNCGHSPVQMMHGTHAYANSIIYSREPKRVSDYIDNDVQEVPKPVVDRNVTFTNTVGIRKMSNTVKWEFPEMHVGCDGLLHIV